MFFVLSKILALALYPSNVLIALGLIGVVLMATRWRRIGRRLAAVSLVLLAVVGFAPFGRLLAAPLEDRFPPWTFAGPAPAGIIVLGGAIDPTLSRERGEAVIGQSFQRLTIVPKLARAYPDARIVYSGGNGELLSSEAREADFAGPVLESLGVPHDRLILERDSRNTAENAAFTKALVDPKPGERWLLVTSASHMPRAIGCFRQVGFDVEAVPVGGRQPGSASRFWPMRTLGLGLAQLDDAMREWIGLFAYRITGRTDALLPGPKS
jgi:uncharacterized SAM-binding protein YcdF (DUF218 family)